MSKLSIKASLVDNELSKLKNQTAVSKTSKGSGHILQNTSGEADLDIDNSIRNIPDKTESSGTTDRDKLEAFQKAPDSSGVKRQLPVMPGAGFASITPEFLENLSKK